MIKNPTTLDVVCDGCGAEDELPTTEYRPFPLALPWFKTYGVDPATLSSEHWLAAGERLYCPHCANVREGVDA